jgi:hypothetical protein
MDFQRSLQRVQTQLDALERMIRIMRSELETQSSAFAPEDIAKARGIKSGLGTLFETGAAMNPVSATPYDPVVPDLWVGLDQETGAASVTLSARSLPVTSPATGVSRVTRLNINPVFPTHEKPRWVTLETAVDLDGLSRAKALRIDVISSLDIAKGNRAELPKTIGLTLRTVDKVSGSKDWFHYRFPISTVPFEHGIHVNEAAMKGLDLSNAKSVVCILELPQRGDFALQLDWFAVKSVAV